MTGSFAQFPRHYLCAMLAVLRILVDLVVGGAAWVFVVPWCAQLLQRTWRAEVVGPPPDEYALAGGLALGIVGMLWTKPNLLIHTALHEAAHALMCLLLFVRVGSISASAGQGGEIRHSPVDPIRAIPILIAPYTLPMILGPVLLARFLCPPGVLQGILSFICGVAISMHLHGLWMNLRLNTFGKGADIPRVGHLLSFALVASSLLLIAAATVAVLYDAQPPAWWRDLFAGREMTSECRNGDWRGVWSSLASCP